MAAVVAVVVLALPFLLWWALRTDDPDAGDRDVRDVRDNVSATDRARTSTGSDAEDGDGADPAAGDDADATPVEGEGIPFSPDSITVGAGSVWVSDTNCGAVVQLDPTTLEIGMVIDIGGSGAGVVFAGDTVWVGNRSINEVFQIDPATGEVVRSVTTMGSTLGLGTDGTSVWAVDPFASAVHRIDIATATLAATVAVGFDPHYVAGTDGAAWVTNVGDDTVTRIDTTTGDTRTFPVGAAPLHVAIGDGSVWVTNSGDDTVTRLDAETGEVEATIDVGGWPHALAVAGDAVWVGTETNELWRIDPATDTAELVPGAEFNSIDMTADGTAVWVADSSAGDVVHVDGLTGEVVDVANLGDQEDCASLLGRAGEPLDPSQA